ncbi:MAG: hypothetical protein U0136_08855 [Bdellovibrionota bacterium]
MKIMTRLTLGVVAVALPSVALADVYQCDGKWTNKPCSGNVTQTINETHSPSVSDPVPSQNRSLFHELTMKSIKAREEYDVKVDLSSAEKICLQQTASLEDCKKALDAVETALDQKVASASAAAEQKKANALQQEANRIQEERNKIEENKPNVTVVERRPVIVVPRDRPIYGHDHYGHGLEGHESAASIQVTGSAANGNGSITVNGSASTTTGNVITAPGSVVPLESNHPVIVSDHSGTHVTPGPFAKPRKNPSSAGE